MTTRHDGWVSRTITLISPGKRRSIGLSPRRATCRRHRPSERQRARDVHRYYDPGTGQFVSVDPLVDETGQAYTYTGDDPVNGVDPLGLSWTVKNGAQLPSDGSFPYNPPKNAHGQPLKVRGTSSYRDADGDIWQWDPVKREWDVVHRDGTHTNVSQEGEITHGPNNAPNKKSGRNSGEGNGDDDTCLASYSYSLADCGVEGGGVYGGGSGGEGDDDIPFELPGYVPTVECPSDWQAIEV